MAKPNNIDWTTFSTNSSEFLKAEKADSLSRLLHEYFSKNSVVNESFIDELAKFRPKLLIDSIRTNRAFLHPAHSISLKQLKSYSDQYVQTHARFFSRLCQDEEFYFGRFERSCESIGRTAHLEVLLVCALWFESKRAGVFLAVQDDIIRYELNSQMEVINFFLSYYFFHLKHEESTYRIQKDDDYQVFSQLFSKLKSTKELESHSVWIALNEATVYNSFSKGILEIYCFDLNYEPDADNYAAVLSYQNESKHKRWFIENAKFEIWLLFYRSLAEAFVQEEIKTNPKFIPDTTGYDYVMNHEGAVRKLIAHQICDEFALDDGSIDGVKYEWLIRFLNGFVSNAWGRYVNPLDELNSKDPHLWLRNIFENAISHGNQGVAAAPLRSNSHEDMILLVEKNLPEASSKARRLIQLISTDVRIERRFNKFKTLVNLIGQPFLKIGDQYISLNGIVGETNAQVNLLINLLESNYLKHSHESKKESSRLELKIHSMFKKAGFPNTICSAAYKEGEFQGDFDVLVYERGVLLLLEIKSTKLRIHLSDSYDDLQNSLMKASNQLGKATIFIRTHFQRFKECVEKDFQITEDDSKLLIYPMIVSTSFENDHVLIRNQHLKISLFELQNLLSREIELTSENRLSSLIHTITSNTYWKYLEENIKIPEIHKRPYITPL